MKTNRGVGFGEVFGFQHHGINASVYGKQGAEGGAAGDRLAIPDEKLAHLVIAIVGKEQRCQLVVINVVHMVIGIHVIAIYGEDLLLYVFARLFGHPFDPGGGEIGAVGLAFVGTVKVGGDLLQAPRVLVHPCPVGEGGGGKRSVLAVNLKFTAGGSTAHHAAPGVRRYALLMEGTAVKLHVVGG